jgi:hypothetical protein
MSEIDAVLDRLYSAPLTRFVAMRREAARELRARGDRESAGAIDKIARPGIVQWCLNQLARRHREPLRDFLAAVDRQRAVQLGKGGSLDVDTLRQAHEREKEAAAELLGHAREVLASDGHAQSKSQLDRVVRALRSAALDPEMRDALVAGRLVSEPAEAGFDALGALADAATLPARAAPPLVAVAAPRAEPEPRTGKRDDAFARSARAHATRGPARGPQARAAELEKARAEVDGLSKKIELAERELASMRERLERSKARLRDAERSES